MTIEKSEERERNLSKVKKRMGLRNKFGMASAASSRPAVDIEVI